MSSSSTSNNNTTSNPQQQQQQLLNQLLNKRPHSARGSHAQNFLNLQKDRSDIIPISVREAVAHISERKVRHEQQKYELEITPTPNNPFAEMMRKDEERREAQAKAEREQRQREREVKQAKFGGGGGSKHQNNTNNKNNTLAADAVHHHHHHQSSSPIGKEFSELSSTQNNNNNNNNTKSRSNSPRVPPSANKMVKRPATAPKRQTSASSSSHNKLPYNPLVKKINITRPTLLQRYEQQQQQQQQQQESSLTSEAIVNDAAEASTKDTNQVDQLALSSSFNNNNKTSNRDQLEGSGSLNTSIEMKNSKTNNNVGLRTPRKPPVPLQKPVNVSQQASSPTEIADEKTRKIHTEAANFCSTSLLKILSSDQNNNEEDHQQNGQEEGNNNSKIERVSPKKKASSESFQDLFEEDTSQYFGYRPPSSFGSLTGPTRSSSRPPSSSSAIKNNFSSKNHNNTSSVSVDYRQQIRKGSSPLSVTSRPGSSTSVLPRRPPSAPLVEQIQRQNEITTANSVQHHSTATAANPEKSIMMILKSEEEFQQQNASITSMRSSNNNNQNWNNSRTSTLPGAGNSSTTNNQNMLDDDEYYDNENNNNNNNDDKIVDELFQKSLLEKSQTPTETRVRQIHSAGVRKIAILSPEQERARREEESKKKHLNDQQQQQREESTSDYTEKTQQKWDGYTFDDKSIGDDFASSTTARANRRFSIGGSSTSSSTAPAKAFTPTTLASTTKKRPATATTSVSFVNLAASSSSAMNQRKNSVVSSEGEDDEKNKDENNKQEQQQREILSSSSRNGIPPRPSTASSPPRSGFASSSIFNNNNNNNNTSTSSPTPSPIIQQEEHLLQQANDELANITNQLLAKTLASRRTYHSLAAWAEGSLQEALGAAHNERNETEPAWVEEELQDIPELRSISGPGASSIASTLVVLNSIFTLDPAVSQTWGGIWLTIRNILLSGLFGTDGAFSLQKEMLRGMTRFHMNEEDSFARALCTVPSLTEAVQHARTRCAIMKKKITSKDEMVKGLDMALAKHIKIFEVKRSFLVFRAWRDWAAKNRWQRYSKSEFSQKCRNKKVLKTIFDAWRRVSITLERIKSEQERDNAKMEAKHAKLTLHKAVADAKAELHEEVTTAKRHLAEERALRQAQVSALTMETERLLNQRDDLQTAVEQFSLEGRLWHNLWVEHRPMHFDLFELPSMSTLVAKSVTSLQESLSPLFARTVIVSQMKNGNTPLIAPQAEGVFEHQQHLQRLNQQPLTNSHRQNNNNTIDQQQHVPAPLTAQVQSSLTSSKQSLSKFLFDWANAFLVAANYPRMVISEKDLRDGDAIFFMLKEILKSARQLLRVDKYPRSLLDKIVFGIEKIDLRKEATPGHAVVALFRIALDAFAVFPFFPPLLQVCPFAGTHFTPAKMLSPEFSEWWQYLLATIFVMWSTLPVVVDFLVQSTHSSPQTFVDASSRLVDQGLRSKITRTMRRNKKREEWRKMRGFGYDDGEIRSSHLLKSDEREEMEFFDDDDDDDDKNNESDDENAFSHDDDNNQITTPRGVRFKNPQDVFASEGLINLPRRKTRAEKYEEELDRMPEDEKFNTALEKDVMRAFGDEKDDEVRLNEDFIDESLSDQNNNNNEDDRESLSSSNDDNENTEKDKNKNPLQRIGSAFFDNKESGTTKNNNIKRKNSAASAASSSTRRTNDDKLVLSASALGSGSASARFDQSMTTKSPLGRVNRRSFASSSIRSSSEHNYSQNAEDNNNRRKSSAATAPMSPLLPSSASSKKKTPTTSSSTGRTGGAVKLNPNLIRPTIASALKQNVNSPSNLADGDLLTAAMNEAEHARRKKPRKPRDVLMTLGNRGTVPIQCLLGQHHFAHVIEGKPVKVVHKSSPRGGGGGTRHHHYYNQNGSIHSGELSDHCYDDDTRSVMSRSTSIGKSTLQKRQSFMSSSSHGGGAPHIAFGRTTAISSSPPSVSTTSQQQRNPNTGARRMSIASSILPNAAPTNNNFETQSTVSRTITPPRALTAITSSTSDGAGAGGAGGQQSSSPSNSPSSKTLLPNAPASPPPAHLAHLSNSPLIRSRGRGGISPILEKQQQRANNYLLSNIMGGKNLGGASAILQALGLNPQSSATIANFDKHFETIQKSAEEHQNQWKTVLEKWQTAIKWENLFERDVAGSLMRSLNESNLKKKKIPQTVQEIEEILKKANNDDDSDNNDSGDENGEQNKKNQHQNNNKNAPTNKIQAFMKKFGPLEVYPPHHSLATTTDETKDKIKSAGRNKNIIHPFYYRYGHQEEEEHKNNTDEKNKKKQDNKNKNMKNMYNFDDDDDDDHNEEPPVPLPTATGINVINERQTAWEQVIRQRAWYSAARLVATAVAEFHVLEWLPDKNSFRTIEICPVVREIIKETNNNNFLSGNAALSSSTRNPPRLRRKSLASNSDVGGGGGRKASKVFASSLNSDPTAAFYNNNNNNNNNNNTSTSGAEDSPGSIPIQRDESISTTTNFRVNNAFADIFGEDNNGDDNNSTTNHDSSHALSTQQPSMALSSGGGVGAGNNSNSASLLVPRGGVAPGRSGSVRVFSPHSALSGTTTSEENTNNKNNNTDDRTSQGTDKPSSSAASASSRRNNNSPPNQQQQQQQQQQPRSSAVANLLFNETIMSEMQKP